MLSVLFVPQFNVSYHLENKHIIIIIIMKGEINHHTHHLVIQGKYEICHKHVTSLNRECRQQLDGFFPLY